MRGIEYSQQLGREVDQLGHNFLTFHNHSKRHNGVVGVLARAARQTVKPKPQTVKPPFEISNDKFKRFDGSVRAFERKMLKF